MCESFFATLECELLDRTPFRTQSEARLKVFDFIEGFYNTHRRHSALGYVSPIEYEECAEDARGAARATRFRRTLGAEPLPDFETKETSTTACAL
jgi:hypothetical protein